MDILIDLIVYLIKQASKPSAPRPLPPTQQQAQRQQSMLAEQIQAMQKTMTAQQSQRRSAGRSNRATQLAGAARVTTSVLPPPVRVTVAPPAEVVERPTIPQSSRAAGLRMPFLLGELLSVPVALRDSEF